MTISRTGLFLTAFIAYGLIAIGVISTLLFGIALGKNLVLENVRTSSNVKIKASVRLNSGMISFERLRENTVSPALEIASSEWLFWEDSGLRSDVRFVLPFYIEQFDAGSGPTSPARLRFEVSLLYVSPIVFILGILVLKQYRSGKRRQRFSLELCPDCGYDVRDITLRCPECGSFLPRREKVSNLITKS